MNRLRHAALIDCGTLARHLGDPDWRIFDCRFDLTDADRGRRVHAESHIPGAAYAHLNEVLSNPVTADTGRHPLPDISGLCDWLGQHGVTDGVQVVVYDDSGGSMAVRLWWLLRWLGHTGVAVLDGGWPQWTALGLVTETSPPQQADGADFKAVPDWDQVVTTEQVLAAVNGGMRDLSLVDVRTRQRFDGIDEPIDPVAGHVPGAVNLPLSEFLDNAQCFLPVAVVRDILVRKLGEQRHQAVVAMCGSGVTACHLLLAMEVAGLGKGRLYAGSWSEWIRDPNRPIAASSN